MGAFDDLLVRDVAWDPDLHPRGEHGQFSLSGATSATVHDLPKVPAADADRLRAFGVTVHMTDTDTHYDPATRTIHLEHSIADAASTHEAGHALDHALGWPSQTAAYRAIAKPLGGNTMLEAAEVYARAYAAAHDPAQMPYSWDPPGGFIIKGMKEAVDGALRIAREGRRTTQELGLNVSGPLASLS